MSDCSTSSASVLVRFLAHPCHPFSLCLLVYWSARGRFFANKLFAQTLQSVLISLVINREDLPFSDCQVVVSETFFFLIECWNENQTRTWLVQTTLMLKPCSRLNWYSSGLAWWVEELCFMLRGMDRVEQCLILEVKFAWPDGLLHFFKWPCATGGPCPLVFVES